MSRRPVNEVDFWRGFALVTIFVNHIPGITYENLTYRNLSLSDSAELFVFLAGWSLRHVVGPHNDPTPTSRLIYRLGGRVLAVSARVLDNPLLLEWHNAAAVFTNPADTHIGLVILSHQLGYFDILPLYVVLMLIAPGIAVVHRFAPSWLVPISLAVYLWTLLYKITIPTWPTEGQWFFNPLCWQLVFVLGFTMSRQHGPGHWVRSHIVQIRLMALPIVIVSAALVLAGWWPDPTTAPEPKLFFINGKTFATPMRVIQFLALVAVFSAVYPKIVSAVPEVVGFLSMLGRHSLYVFALGSVLSLAGQILRFYFGGGLLVDTVLVTVGIALLGAIAWLADWRDRLPQKA